MERTVLVVDDQLINCKILSKILETEYSVVMAENGKRALEILQSEKYSISAVLLDVIMPVMNGYEMLRELRKEETFAALPVIITTQKESESAELEALNCGANDFISKPYHPEIIRLRLRNLIQMTETRETLSVLEIDNLTGLLTKEAFYHKIELLLHKEEKCYQIVAADIERFKVYNDIYGEDKGDELLRFVAGKINDNFSADAFMAHGYADQFFLFLESTDDLEERIYRIAEGMKEYVSATKIILKFGIYDVGREELAVGAMCDRAVLAAGAIKNQYDKVLCYYNDTLREKLITEQKITSIMNEALKEHQFQVYYQPKFGAETEAVVGAEALVRWIHPEYGFMSPGEFVPVFEKNGFVTEMDKYVWEEVCIFLQKQIKEGRPCIPVSVNVSRKDIISENLTELFPKLVKKYGLEPKCLHLEVTESAYATNPQQLIEVMTDLRKSGFVIEMDDFGSGYSSLNTLSELPIDILKLDMKFIQSEFLHKNTSNIISSVINLAKWMNLLVVAEGVETLEQLKHLRDLKCNFIQGYYFAKPMPEQEFMKLLEEKEVLPIYDINSYVQNTLRRNVQFVGGNTMLVVDDLALNRAILCDYFEEEYNIKECDNGMEAWEYIHGDYENITIIMLDLYMPGMDGFELLKRLKGNELYKRIPVIITSRAGDELAEKLPGVKAEGFLSKPYVKEEAIQLVTKVLANLRQQIRGEDAGSSGILSETERRKVLDNLTETYNRENFERKVKQFLDEKKQQALFILLDVDDLNEVNERLGHLDGDRVLVTVTEILKNLIPYRSVIGRIGGDELAAVFEMNGDEEELHARLDRLCKKLHFQVGTMHITSSVGAYLIPKEERDYQVVYHKADKALLSAKNAGKSQYQIYGDEFKNSAYISSKNASWLLELIPGGIFRYEAEEKGRGRLDFVSDNMYRMLGYNQREFRQKFHNRLEEIIWQEDRERILEEMQKNNRLSENSYEYRIEKEDGSLCWVHHTGRLVIEENKSFCYVSLADITREKLLQEKVRKSETKLRKTIDHLRAGLIEIRLSILADGTYDAGNMRIIYCNRSMALLFDAALEEIISQKVPVFGDSLWKEGKQPELEDSGRVRIQRKNGEERWVEIRIVWMEKRGDVLDAFLTYTDITELVKFRSKENKAE